MAAKVIGENPAADNGKTPANLTTDIDCDECGKPMLIRSGRRGKFLGCSGYPKCKNTGEVPAKLLEELGLNGNGANGSSKPLTPTPSAEPEEIETDLDVE